MNLLQTGTIDFWLNRTVSVMYPLCGGRKMSCPVGSNKPPEGKFYQTVNKSDSSNRSQIDAFMSDTP
jgi:hypothetical protein